MALLVCLLASVAAAQDSHGSIVGQVTDSTQAVIPGASVRATRNATNQSVETRTDQTGYFAIAFLPAGSYTVEVTASGFKTLTKDNVALLTDDTLSLPLVLEIGKVSEHVSVSADSEKLQTSTASRSYRWDPAKLKEMPLIGRQAYLLISLTPGVIFTQEQFGTSGFVNLRGFDINNAFIINGGIQGTNQFLLNGAPISLTGSWQYTPTIDSIQEFKVLTNNYDAQFGRTGGGIVSTTLKSGTNTWNGTVFEYFHNAVFDANTIENNREGAPIGKHNTHQFGGAIGGPIRKDKDFIFASYEGFREVAAYPIVSDTPPIDIRNGHSFSRYGIKVYDPLSAHFCKPGEDTPMGAACVGTYIRVQFPNNAIPASRISAVGQAILQLYPAPNAKGITQNYLALGNTGDYLYDEPTFRWDHAMGDKDRFSVVAAFERGYEYQSNNGFPPPADTGNGINNTLDQNYIAEWTHIVSANTVLDGRLSFGRFTQFFPDSSGAGGLTASQLGMFIPRPPTVTQENPPSINLESYSSIIGNTYTWSSQNQWDFQPNVIHTHGRHVLHMGAEFVHAAIGSAGPGRANGQFSFTRGWTSQYVRGPVNARDGSSIADLLLGTPQSGFIDYNESSYRSWPYWALYVQDYWKVAPKLALNLGLRYDVQLPLVERFNRMNDGFDFSVKNPLSDEIIARWKQLKQDWDKTHKAMPYPDPPAAIYGGRLFTSGAQRRPYNTDWTDLQPRVGVAWNFAPKTVFRAGAGIFYRTATQMNQADGFNQRTNYISSLDGGVHPSADATGLYSLENPFPLGIQAPTGSSAGLLTGVGQAILFDGRQRPIPRTYEYSAGFQRELPWNVMVEASYVGSQTVHDSMTTQYDTVPFSQFIQGVANPNYLNRRLPSPFIGILPATSDLGGPAQVPAYDLLRPFPLFNGITETTDPWAKYRYDSLQILAEKRVVDSAKAGVFLFLLSYTFSKSFESSHRLNPWNLAEKPVHELSALDKPHTLAISGLWDLPIGWGRRWFNSGGRLAGAFLNGWAVDWIATYSSGYPVNQPDAIFTCASSSAPGGQNAEHWFNNDPNCYQARPQYSLRTNPDRFSNIRNPTAPLLNASVEKTFWLTEKYALQFRGESFNVTNTPIPGAPNTDFKNPRFGQLPLAQSNFPRYVQIAAKLIF
ncbi:MAG TPA: TonB-dependent receptor [Bryobacteraceae bacterium]|nr:TonB-dependent receptor [Bryobacteraceae bacterium]